MSSLNNNNNHHHHNPKPAASQLENSSSDPSAQFDLGISLALHAWPALTLAVQSSWGGPASSDKRDWFCGAISDLFATRPETDAEDVEDVLIQVMNDEFDVVVDDGSAGDVAVKICEIRELCARGEYGEVQAMWVAWKEKTEKKGEWGAGGLMFQKVEARDEDQETDEGEDEDGCEDDDIEMDEAPAPVRTPREKPEPEVDEEGFTKVARRRK
jgi:pre-rRNA-processing protein TSR2